MKPAVWLALGVFGMLFGWALAAANEEEMVTATVTIPKSTAAECAGPSGCWVGTRKMLFDLYKEGFNRGKATCGGKGTL